MTFTLATLLVFTSFVSSSRVRRQPYPCVHDDCLNAIDGTGLGSSGAAIGSTDCSNYMTTTVVFDPV